MNVNLVLVLLQFAERVKMIRDELKPAQQAQLDTAVVNLNNLNAQLRYFDACKILSLAEKIEKAVCGMKKKRLIIEIRKLLKDCKNIPVHMHQALH